MPDTGAPSPSSARRELLETLLSSLAAGAPLDVEALRARHGGRPEELASLTRALERYRELLRDVRSARGNPALAAGERLGDFEVEALVARGGMGEVYRARQLSLGGRPVALKVTRVRESERAALRRFEREALVLSGLHHPHLAEVHGFGGEGPYRFLAMRLVEGRSLARHLEAGGAVPPRRAARWAEEVASALAAVHAAGLVHRDVKPSNVVIEERGRGAPSAVLVDFGLARPVGSQTATRSGRAPLTEAYAAPEQLLGGEVDARADVFSLGAVLGDLLAGRRPTERGPAATCAGTFGAVAGVDRDLRAVVARATAPDPKRRYADAGELHAELLAWREGRPVRARRVGARGRLAFLLRTHRRRALRWTARTAGIAALFLVGVWIRGLVLLRAELREAAAAFDLPALAALEHRLPEPLRPLLFADAHALALLVRLGEARPADPLTRIVERESRGDRAGALRAAAAAIARAGPAADREVLEFALRAVQQRSEHALSLLAMACNEAPADDPAELAGTAPLREAARRIWRSPDADEHDRLHALSLLGAVGDAADARELGLAACAPQLPDETRRLVLESLERVLRRAHRTGEEAAVLDGVPWDRVLAGILRRRVERSPLSWGANAATSRLCVALHLARRRLGRPTSVWEALPASWLEEPANWKGLGLYEPVHELAAVADARVRGFLEVLDAERVHEWQGWLAGRVAGFLDDPGFLDEAARVLVGLGWEREAALASLRSGAAEARLERDEARTEGDRWTDGGFLSADAAAEEEVPLPLACSAEPCLHFAAWRITHAEPPCACGQALGARVLAAELHREGTDPASLLLREIGRSRVTLEFVQPPDAPAPVELLVVGQLSARRYLPHQGFVRMGLALDGRPIGAQAASGVAGLRLSFALPATWLAPGPHELTLSLEEASTTSFHLHAAYLPRAQG